MSYAMASDDELAQLQKLSNEYQPEAAGPLVGPRQSTAAITTEYANGDPVYRAKTQNLPYKYSHYRTCRGDGHCGWRAVAFGYFEGLQRIGDRGKFLEEQSRLRSLANLLNQIGLQTAVWEDFADETFGLLSKLSNLPAANETPLLESFNEMMMSMAIITYLKLLTSAWIQTHPQDFEPFLLGQDLQQYCRTSVEASNCEIEHVTLTALFQVLLKPAGFSLEVLYLDRSAGEEGDMYRFDATTHDGLLIADAPTVRLLYRPGHYDILYKAEEVQHTMAPQMPTQVAVNLAPHFNEDYVHMNREFSDVLAYIPGMGASGFAPTLGQPSYMADPFGGGFSPTPAQPPQPPPQLYSPLPVTHSQDYVAPSVPLEAPPTVGLTIPATGKVVERGGPFRPSAYELKQDFASGPSHSPTFQTSIFKK
ncbi:COP9 signalosome complex subunit 2 [Neofusicoccum parvum]|uniref:COP9 signalosome complex subunit 2 n=1 Tax=Neofusicoccum parvum TaxID=310453 RepID=A0ACB5SGL6_9PEZI|nr:COP9 signalosome complex subunit 2 [Neofusicoccum parvum]GME66507.1 COP9 signalosome complex subunit 2 [Neofusicoccum parvum]